MKIPKVSEKSHVTNVTELPSNTKDPKKEMEIHFFCDQLQKTIKDTEASAVAEARKERSRIQQES
jgi:hypothetical protein